MKLSKWQADYFRAFEAGDKETMLAMVTEKRNDLARRFREAKKRVKANKARNGGVYVPESYVLEGIILKTLIEVYRKTEYGKLPSREYCDGHDAAVFIIANRLLGMTVEHFIYAENEDRYKKKT